MALREPRGGSQSSGSACKEGKIAVSYLLFFPFVWIPRVIITLLFSLVVWISVYCIVFRSYVFSTHLEVKINSVDY